MQTNIYVLTAAANVEQSMFIESDRNSQVSIAAKKIDKITVTKAKSAMQQMDFGIILIIQTTENHWKSKDKATPKLQKAIACS